MQGNWGLIILPEWDAVRETTQTTVSAIYPSFAGDLYFPLKALAPVARNRNVSDRAHLSMQLPLKYWIQYHAPNKQSGNQASQEKTAVGDFTSTLKVDFRISYLDGRILPDKGAGKREAAADLTHMGICVG